jgi:hypothetical protein
MDLFNSSRALFSKDRNHRLWLYRGWDAGKCLVVIGLNPSNFYENKNDNTITKVIKIARYNGYSGVYMCNLFTFITPYPKSIIMDDNDYGIANNVLKEFGEGRDVCFAWGNFKEAETRAKEVIAMFPHAFCLKKNKNGSPKHPLYCIGNTKLIPFQPQINFV